MVTGHCLKKAFDPLSADPHRMVRHTQTIIWQTDKLFECVGPFCGVGTYRDMTLKML